MANPSSGLLTSGSEYLTCHSMKTERPHSGSGRSDTFGSSCFTSLGELEAALEEQQRRSCTHLRKPCWLPRRVTLLHTLRLRRHNMTLHRESLRLITGLPRHTRTEELYRYAPLPPHLALITERAEGFNSAAAHTGQLMHNLASAHSASLPLQLPPVRAYWEDILVCMPKRLSHLYGRNHHHHERAATAACTGIRHGTIFTTVVLRETTLRTSLSGIDG